LGLQLYNLISVAEHTLSGHILKMIHPEDGGSMVFIPQHYTEL